MAELELSKYTRHIILAFSISQEWIGKKLGPKNRKKNAIVKLILTLNQAGTTELSPRIIVPNYRSWKSSLRGEAVAVATLKNTVRKDNKLEYGLEANRPPQPSWRHTVTGP